LICK